MFVHCNKNLHIQEGSEELNLQRGFVGQVDDRWGKHWFILAAIADGTIEAPDAGKRAKKAKSSEEAPDAGKRSDSEDAKTE